MVLRLPLSPRQIPDLRREMTFWGLEKVFCSEKRLNCHGKRPLGAAKGLLPEGKSHSPPGKTFWSRERSFNPRKYSFPAGKDFLGAGKGLLPEGRAQSGGEKTFCLVAEGIPAGN